MKCTDVFLLLQLQLETPSRHQTGDYKGEDHWSGRVMGEQTNRDDESTSRLREAHSWKHIVQQGARHGIFVWTIPFWPCHR